MKLKIKIFGLVFLNLVWVAGIANAQGLVNCANGANNCQISDLIGTLRLIINSLLSWAGLVGILFIVVAGLRMMLAGGNEEMITQAKTTLTHAIVGFIIILTSFIILNFVIGLLTGGGSFDVNTLMSDVHLVP